MKQLLLLRHAKSAWPDGVEDHDRPLADRGRRDAPRMGASMAKAGLQPDFALVSSAYTVLVAFLLVSRVPVWSGKSEGGRIRKDLVLPVMLVVVIYVATLMSFTWETMVVTVALYLASLPFGARAWYRKYGGWPATDASVENQFPGESDES